MSDNENGKGVSRRTLLGTTAAAAGVGLAGGAALDDGRQWVRHGRGCADEDRGAEGAGCATGGAEDRSGARRTRRILRVLLERPVRRDADHRAPVDARTDARSSLQPLQRDRLGPDQRKPEGSDRRDAAGDPRIPQEPRRHVHERRPASPAHLVHGRHLRRPLRLHERQGQQPRGAGAARRHEVRQDHRTAEPAYGSRLAAAEVSAHRIRLLQRRRRRAAAERRQGPRQSEGVPLDLHGARRRHHEGRLAGDREWQSRQRRFRLSRQILLLDLLQRGGRRHPGRDDRQRAGLGRHLQPQADRGGGQEGRLQGNERRARDRRPQGVALHALRSGLEQSARHQHRAGRHPFRRGWKAFANRDGV